MVYDGTDRKYRLSDSDVGAALLGRDYLGSITHIADSEGTLWRSTATTHGGACRYWRAVRMLARRAAVDSVVEAVSMSVESNVMEACE